MNKPRTLTNTHLNTTEANKSILRKLNSKPEQIIMHKLWNVTYKLYNIYEGKTHFKTGHGLGGFGSYLYLESFNFISLLTINRYILWYIQYFTYPYTFLN